MAIFDGYFNESNIAATPHYMAQCSRADILLNSYLYFFLCTTTTVE